MTSKGLITILKTKGKVICNIYFPVLLLHYQTTDMRKSHLLKPKCVETYDEVNPYYKVKGNEEG